MKKYKSSFTTLGIFALSLSLLSACGRSRIYDLPLSPTVESYVQTHLPQPGATPLPVKSLRQQQLDQIIETLDGIVKRMDALIGGEVAVAEPEALDDSALPGDVAIGQTPPASPGQTPKPQAPSTKPSQPTAPKPSAPEINILQEIAHTIQSAVGIEALIDKQERNLKNGESTPKNLRLSMDQTQVKIEVLPGSPQSGTKLYYKVGASKVSVRPNGALSFITTDLPHTDERIASTNGYILPDTDFLGMARRLSMPQYKAQLLGKTQVDGQEIHVIKVTSDGPNTLDPAIKFEHVAYNPKTYTIKYWEAFADSDKEPYIRYLLKTFEIKSIPASTFKL